MSKKNRIAGFAVLLFLAAVLALTACAAGLSVSSTNGTAINLNLQGTTTSSSLTTTQLSVVSPISSLTVTGLTVITPVTMSNATIVLLTTNALPANTNAPNGCLVVSNNTGGVSAILLYPYP